MASHAPAPIPPPPSRTDTLVELLDRTGPGVVPIRREFVQQGHGRYTVPGPLAGLLTAHDERGLDAYLLVHCAGQRRALQLHPAYILVGASAGDRGQAGQPRIEGHAPPR